jgi:hypothetical protein
MYLKSPNSNIKSFTKKERGEDVMKGNVSLVKNSKGVVNRKALHEENSNGVNKAKQNNVVLSRPNKKSYLIRRS